MGETKQDKAAFRSFLRTLKITTMQDCLDQRATMTTRRAAGNTALVSMPGLNIAFTHAGLDVLGADDLNLPEFTRGMAASRARLADPVFDKWTILRPWQPIHGVFLVTGATETEVDNTIAVRLAPQRANGWTHVHIEVGSVRPKPFEGHEHFGYADGVSQPAVRGLVAPDEPLDPTTGSDPDQAEPGRDLLWPGEFVFGYSGQHPDAGDLSVEGPRPEPDTEFTRNGAFLVFRRLAQDVPEFDLAVKRAALSLDPSGGELSADLLGAQLVGRWKSGAPLINAPHTDDSSVAEGTPGALDFEFDEDRFGLICPSGAHIRKAYARDDVPGDIAPTKCEIVAAEAVTQRHRMLRRGITFGPELTEAEALSGTTTKKRGLLFVCYVTDIREQFEIVQASRCNSPDFVQPEAGVDAVIGQNHTSGPLPFTAAMPFSKNKKPQLMFDRFVHMEGGEYFFAPSLSTVRRLAGQG